jgi:hypothetical protein
MSGFRKRFGLPSIPAGRGPSPGASRFPDMRDALDSVVTSFF